MSFLLILLTPSILGQLLRSVVPAAFEAIANYVLCKAFDLSHSS